jgi:hypothetical protein
MLAARQYWLTTTLLEPFSHAWHRKTPRLYKPPHPPSPAPAPRAPGPSSPSQTTLSYAPHFPSCFPLARDNGENHLTSNVVVEGFSFVPQNICTSQHLNAYIRLLFPHFNDTHIATLLTVYSLQSLDATPFPRVSQHPDPTVLRPLYIPAPRP